MKILGKQVILESLKEIVNPEHTALVFWDCQNGLVSNIFNRDEYLANLEALLVVTRRQQIPVIYTKITPMPAGYQSAWSIYQSMKRFSVDDPSKIPVFMKPGSPEADINADYEDYIILGACSPPLAYELFQVSKDVGLVIPCNVVVFVDKGNTFVEATTPTALINLFQDNRLKPTAEKVEAKLKKVVDSVN
jgi:hypothetical protein